MNNSMVAHLWANEKKESARGNKFFFEGKSIYSYGYHFEIVYSYLPIIPKEEKQNTVKIEISTK